MEDQTLMRCFRKGMKRGVGKHVIDSCKSDGAFAFRT